MPDFDKAFELVVGHEGGFVNDPADPGGRTIYGITERDHPDLWTAGPPSLNVCKQRYREQYWEPIKGDQLPWPMSLFVFDAAVNQGAKPAVMMLQRALDTAQDGILGRQTLALAAKATDWHLGRYMAFRALRYQGTRNFDRFGEGWLTRIFRVAMEGSR